MNINDVKKIISNGESITVEYKKSIAEIEKLGRAMSGLLNVKGGFGLLGITDKGRIVGVEVTDSTKKKLTTFLNHFDPQPQITIEYIPLDESDKMIVVFVCEQSRHAQPYTYKGRAYLKTQSGKTLMSVERYRALLLESAGVSKAWESMDAEGFTLNDLDHDEIVRSFKIGLREQRIPEDEYTEEPAEILRHFDLAQDSKINNAAMVLFARKMPAAYSQCFIRMGRFLDDTMDDVLDSKQFRGNAFQLLHGAQEFVRKHIPISSRFDPNQFERIDEAALPLLAVREAIINAICHRDYANRAGDISLYIFNDCLEIHNIGHLFGGLTVEELSIRHPSRRRNEKVAQVFHARKLIDRFGGGTRRMVRLCEESGLPAPTFIEESDGLLVRFCFRTPIGPQSAIKPVRAAYQLTERQLEILQVLAGNSYVSLRDIVSALKHPPAARTVGDDLAFLKSIDLANSKGTGRGAVWFLENKPVKGV